MPLGGPGCAVRRPRFLHLSGYREEPFKGQNNQSLRLVDLAKIDFDRAGLSRHGIFADPKPGDRFYEDYVVAQDVTDLLGSSHFRIPSAD